MYLYARVLLCTSSVIASLWSLLSACLLNVDALRLLVPSVMEFFMLCFTRFCGTFSLLVHKAKQVVFANQWVCQLEVWLLPSLFLVRLIRFVLAALLLFIALCGFWNICWLISLSIIDIFQRSCWIIKYHEAQPALFQFCRHVESMTIDYHEAIRLDPRLCAMKFFVFIFVILQNHSFTKKGHTDPGKQLHQ